MTSPAIPISALLAPQRPHSAPRSFLPSPSAAILGPLPPTTPLHLVLNYIALSDLPEYEYATAALHQNGQTGAVQEEEGKGKEKQGYAASAPADRPQGKNGGPEPASAAPARALIITGNKDGLFHALQDDDEDWMRDHGSDYGVMARLKLCDIR